MHRRIFVRIPELYFRLSLPWWDAALLLGMAAAYPVKMVTRESLGVFGWLYFEKSTDPAVTWFNFLEWDGFFQLCLVLMIIGILVLGLLFFFSMGIKGLLGSVFGISTFFFLGFGYMSLYAWLYERICINALNENFLAGMLNIICGFPQIIPVFMLPIFGIAFLMPQGLITAFVQLSELREKQRRYQARRRVLQNRDSETEDTYAARPEKKTAFPNSLRAPSGETYWLNYENGERAEYLCSRTGDRVSFHSADFDDGCPSGWNAY